jgi:hypothetical protein
MLRSNMTITIDHARDLNELRAELKDLVMYERSLPGIKRKLNAMLVRLERIVSLDADRSGNERPTVPYTKPESLRIEPTFPPGTLTAKASQSVDSLRAINFFDVPNDREILQKEGS